MYDVDLINLICVSNEGSVLLSSLVFIRRGLLKSSRVGNDAILVVQHEGRIKCALSVVRLSLYGGVKSHG